MKIKKTLIWSIIHDKAHKTLGSDEKRIDGALPLVSVLFPGINYYSMSGFYQVMNDLIKPVLRRLFAELITTEESDVGVEEVEIAAFLPSNGYEWQDSALWQKKFKNLLDAA